MSLSIWIACTVAAAVLLLIRKAAEVARSLDDGSYRVAEFMRIFVVWFGMTAASFYLSCGVVGCQFGLRFGWAGELLQPLNLAPPIAYVAVAMLIYAMLSAYLAGHISGWLAFGAGRLKRRMFA